MAQKNQTKFWVRNTNLLLGRDALRQIAQILQFQDSNPTLPYVHNIRRREWRRYRRAAARLLEALQQPMRVLTQNVKTLARKCIEGLTRAMTGSRSKKYTASVVYNFAETF